MLVTLVEGKRVIFYRVLMDSGYEAKELRRFIAGLNRYYDVPRKCSRQVDDSGDVLK
ncbi:MAG: hypothetical protein FD135_513 [Comamonadaceae bacterium]|nr:MAG: hypothetical protein FD135_513 [Comamonadaceae bacterium]